MRGAALVVAGVLTGVAVVIGAAFVLSYLLEDERRDFWPR